MSGPHPSHKTRFSDASTFDEICVYCGATDQVPGGWGQLAYPCPDAPKKDNDHDTTDVRQVDRDTGSGIRSDDDSDR